MVKYGHNAALNLRRLVGLFRVSVLSVPPPSLITASLLNPFQQEQIGFLAFMFAAIVVGNVTVLAATGSPKRGKNTRMSFFILHLAIAGKCYAGQRLESGKSL